MTRTPEGVVKARVRKILDNAGAYYFMPATGGYGRSGVPDFVACIKGQFWGIECKAGKGETTALQRRELRLIREAGGIAVVVDEVSVSYLEDAFKHSNIHSGETHESKTEN